MNGLKKLYYCAVCAALTLWALAFPAAAMIVNDNPQTGDTVGSYMPYVLGALGVSLVVIIIIAATSSRKKK